MGFENFWQAQSEKDTAKQIQEGIADFEEEKQRKEKGFEIPKELISTEDLIKREGITLEEIYEWYEKAISRRDREPLEIDRFVSHFEGMSFEPTFAYGEKERGYLLGFYKYGVFIPTHFAPKTIRTGYELIDQLGESTEVPALMAVTEDLENTLSKMPSWMTIDTSFLSSFRDGMVEKKIVYNSHPDVRNLMYGLVAEYLEQAKGYENAHHDDDEEKD